MSATTLDRLIRMANQIAAEFTHQQPGNAAEATYDHLWHFWDPRMTAAIVDYWLTDGTGLSPAAAAAVARLGKGREPEPQTRATEFAGPDETAPLDDGG